MLITVLGIRGTVPSEDSGTVGLLINAKYAFDIPPEFIQSMIRARTRWNEMLRGGQFPKEFHVFPAPNLGKIEHLFISHFHWDHWGGLAHYLRWLRLFHHDLRKERPLNIYIPEGSMIPFKHNLIKAWNIDEELVMAVPDDLFFLRFLSVELHESISDIVRIHVMKPQIPVLLEDGQIRVTGIETKHLPQGSMAYRIDSCKEKVDMQKLEELGLSPGPIIGKIKKSPNGINVNGKTVFKDDIIRKECVSACYSGDSPINEHLDSFYANTDLLIHDCSYLSSDDGYYLERHADLESLIHFSKKIVGMRSLVPIHFSHRHEYKEIEEKIKTIMTKMDLSFDVIMPRPCMFILIKKREILIT